MIILGLLLVLLTGVAIFLVSHLIEARKVKSNIDVSFEYRCSLLYRRRRCEIEADLDRLLLLHQKGILSEKTIQ